VAGPGPWTSLDLKNRQLIKGRGGSARKQELLISFAHFSHYTLHEKFLNPLNLLLSLPSKFEDEIKPNKRATM